VINKYSNSDKQVLSTVINSDKQVGLCWGGGLIFGMRRALISTYVVGLYTGRLIFGGGAYVRRFTVYNHRAKKKYVGFRFLFIKT
jgi:hypothetical protein